MPFSPSLTSLRCVFWLCATLKRSVAKKEDLRNRKEEKQSSSHTRSSIGQYPSAKDDEKVRVNEHSETRPEEERERESEREEAKSCDRQETRQRSLRTCLCVSVCECVFV